MSDNTNIDLMQFKLNSLKRLITEAALASKKAHKILFKDSRDKSNEVIAAIYLNKSISYMSAANALYISNYEILEHHQLDTVFNEFNFFESEFLNNVATAHSHQWTDIHFNRFKDAYEAFIGRDL